MRFIIVGAFCVIFDFIRCPLQWLFSFGRTIKIAETLELKSNKIEFEYNEVGIVIHHFSPYGLSFSKQIGNQKFEVGVDSILKEAEQSPFSVFCYVADSTESYFKELQASYPNVNFIRTKGERFDFNSYFESTNLDSYSDFEYIAFFNDNVQEGSNLTRFLLDGVKAMKQNPQYAIAGIGTNTNLTQSVFRRSFSPHIQTYAWLTKAKEFKKFAKRRQIWLKKSYSKPLLKQLICRLFEQGYSKWLLLRGFGLLVIRDKKVFSYIRQNRFFDRRNAWPLDLGDSREVVTNPFKL